MERVGPLTHSRPDAQLIIYEYQGIGKATFMLAILSLIGGTYAGIIIFAIALGKAAHRGDTMREEVYARELEEQQEQDIAHTGTPTARRLAA